MKHARRTASSLPPIGLRVREFRIQRHITQAELARRVGIQAGPMNQLEKGLHVPSGRVLLRLAEVLDVSLDVLCGRAPPTNYVSEERAEYFTGNEGALLLPALDTAEAGEPGRKLMDDLTRSVLALEDLCGAQKRAVLPLHLPFEATSEGAEELASQVRRLLGISHAVVFDYIELLENAGLRVIVADLPGDCASLACIDRPNGNVVIALGSRFTTERKLFRLIFELGRVYWNRQAMDLPRPFMIVRETALDESHFARKFAALFLMPAPVVRATVGQLGITVSGWSYELLLRIKHRFGVSAEAFAIRLEELGLIELTIAERLKKRIRAHYRKSGNAEPDDTRRILSENGRVGDLLTTALARRSTVAEARRIAEELERRGVRWRGEGRV